jgi:hypothetical protein
MGTAPLRQLSQSALILWPLSQPGGTPLIHLVATEALHFHLVDSGKRHFNQFVDGESRSSSSARTFGRLVG